MFLETLSPANKVSCPEAYKSLLRPRCQDFSRVLWGVIRLCIRDGKESQTTFPHKMCSSLGLQAPVVCEDD